MYTLIVLMIIKKVKKMIKSFFPKSTLLNALLISGLYDIDNFFFTFPNKKYEDTNIYNIYNYKNKELLIKVEDI